jgi:hypothetical protein
LVLNTTPPLGDINNAKEFSDKANTFKNIGAAHPRYRFRQDHLIFLNTFTGVRNRSGWILPTAAKILVNVKQTEDAGTWSGQVEGSKERGMFLCTPSVWCSFDAANVHHFQRALWNRCSLLAYWQLDHYIACTPSYI